MARDLGPRGEIPGNHSIEFIRLSIETINALDEIVRVGWNGSLRLAKTTLPLEYPIKELEVLFTSGKYENSPHSPDGNKLPKWISWYTIDTTVELREKQSFSEERARQILNNLQQNAGRGNYRQLPNGHHQIIIPGANEMTPYNSDIYSLNSPHGLPTAILDLGEKRTENPVNSLKIKLASSYITNDGNNMELKGRLDRGHRIDIKPKGKLDRNLEVVADSANRSDYPSRHFGVYSTHLIPYFANVSYMLQAVCNGLGSEALPSVLIPVSVPNSEDGAAGNSEQGIPPAFRNLLKELGVE